MNLSKTRSLILLHFIVFIWGFTGVLGKLINMSSEHIVWNRMSIAFLSLFIINKFIYTHKSIKNKKHVMYYILIGGFVTIHWICFFESIKLSTVSLALICLSSISLFTALLEPLFQKRKILIHELLLSILVSVGIMIIFSYELNYYKAIILSVVSAFFGALFTVCNHQLIKQGHKSTILTSWEMLGGVIFLTIYLIITRQFNLNIIPNNMDILYTLILGLVCTAFAFCASVEIMKKLTPFTINLSVNLEPIYSIILAILIFGQDEKMSLEFYIGGFIILCSIIINTMVKNQKNR